MHTRCSSKSTRKCLAGGLHPDPLRKLKRSPDPLAAKNGRAETGEREGERRGGGRKRKGEVKGREEGKGKEWMKGKGGRKEREGTGEGNEM